MSEKVIKLEDLENDGVFAGSVQVMNKDKSFSGSLKTKTHGKITFKGQYEFPNTMIRISSENKSLDLTASVSSFKMKNYLRYVTIQKKQAAHGMYRYDSTYLVTDFINYCCTKAV